MKKLCSSPAAKIAAVLLLCLFLLIGAASTALTVVLFSENAYFDSGMDLKTRMLSDAAYRTGQLCGDDLLYRSGEDRTARLAYYSAQYAPENSNLCIRITDGDGNTVFENRDFRDAMAGTINESECHVAIMQTEKSFRLNFSDYGALYAYIEQNNLTVYSIEADDDSGSVTAVFTVPYTEYEVYTIKTAVLSPEKMNATDELRSLVRAADLILSLRKFLIPTAAAALLLSAVLFVFLLCAAGHKAGVEGIHLNWADRIPFDLYLAVFAAAGVLSIYAAVDLNGSYSEALSIATGLLLFAVWPLMALAPILSFAARAKAGGWWRNTVIFRVLRLVKRFIVWLAHGIAFVCRRLPLCWKTVLLCAGLSLLELVFLLYRSYPVLWVAEKLLLVPLVILAAVNLQTLKKGGQHIAAGELDYCVDLHGMLPEFRRHGEALNSITDGMQRAVQVQMRSERMKAELITNVSHDIKTPLTSIVNYVDLLKTEGLTSEHAPEYLAVLERQSARLKKLTEDLIEASKASTGNLTVHPERTNVNVLLTQAAGEYEERLKARNLELVTDLRADEAYILADGQLLWRVMDNLLSNICKYSQEHTRVYLQTQAQGGMLTMTFKNISRDALNISGEELTERFVRGDASRSTEGSGLGLSITRSLVELQNGSFALSIDGDLFKAVVTFPLLRTNSDTPPQES